MPNIHVSENDFSALLSASACVCTIDTDFVIRICQSSKLASCHELSLIFKSLLHIPCSCSLLACNVPSPNIISFLNLESCINNSSLSLYYYIYRSTLFILWSQIIFPTSWGYQVQLVGKLCGEL